MLTIKPTVILGGGPAGIGAGLVCGESGILLERTDKPGGLCKSLTIGGAVFDLGGHSFHTPHVVVRERVFASLPMFEQQRNARCFVDAKLIPYPFQQNFHLLDDATRIACEDGLKKATDGLNASNYEEYLRSRFGDGIAEKFMLPYNRKLWGEDLQRLSCDWVNERVAPPKGDKHAIMKDGKRVPLTQNHLVAYPSKGGFEQVFTTLAEEVANISFSDEAYRIDTEERLLYRAGREPLQYRNVISTSPIQNLLQMIDKVPSELLNDAMRLESLEMRIVLIVVDHKVDTPVQRIYAADQDIPFHKLAINHNSSDYLRALPTHGLIAEVSSTPEMTLNDAELKEAVLQSLLQLRLIKKPAEATHIEVHHVKYGYPVPTHGRLEIIERIRSWLADRQIFLAGRFAEWAYINSDEAINRGVNLASMLMHSR